MQAPALTTARLERGLRVTVPANTQILEISFTATDRVVAQQVADAVAGAYLANRAQRFETVTSARIKSIETQTLSVVDDLRAATAASQVGSAAKRAFNSQLADALRNELVSLRAQRTALENSETPVGTVIAPADTGAPAGALPAPVLPIGGALAGLGLALPGRRAAGASRWTRPVGRRGGPRRGPECWPSRRTRSRARGCSAAGNAADFDSTIRRLRAHVLELDPRPEIVTVAPVGTGRSDGLVSEALAESFAKAGHRVVLVRTDGQPAAGLEVEVDGLAEALMHERLSVLDLLQPSIEPLLSLLPPGRVSPQTQDLLASDRLRAALEPLVGVGHLVVVQSPGTGTVEGEAIVGAADLGLVVVDLGRSRLRDLATLVNRWSRRGTNIAGVVLGRRSRRHPGRATSRFGGRRHGIGLDRHVLVDDPAAEQSVGNPR